MLQSRPGEREGAPQISAEAPPTASGATAAYFAPLPKSPASGTGRLADFLAPSSPSLSSSLDRNLRPKTVGGVGLGARPCSAGPRLAERRRSDQTLAIKWLTWDSLGIESKEPKEPYSREVKEAREVEPVEPARSWSCQEPTSQTSQTSQTEKLALATLRSWATTAVTATAKADLECSLSPDNADNADLPSKAYNPPCVPAFRPKRQAKPC